MRSLGKETSKMTDSKTKNVECFSLYVYINSLVALLPILQKNTMLPSLQITGHFISIRTNMTRWLNNEIYDN
jgi:hypothetical protein